MIPKIDEKKIIWPVICFSQGSMQVIFNSDEWGESNVHGVISGWYKQKIIDSAGNVFIVKEISTLPRITFWDRLFSFIVNRNVKVKLVQCDLDSRISLADFKTLICREIDMQEEDRNAWSSCCNPKDLKNEVLSSLSFEAIMHLLI